MKLFSADQIHKRVVVLASEIGPDPVHLVVVLSGAFIFAADLIRQLPQATSEKRCAAEQLPPAERLQGRLARAKKELARLLVVLEKEKDGV